MRRPTKAEDTCLEGLQQIGREIHWKAVDELPHMLHWAFYRLFIISWQQDASCSEDSCEHTIDGFYYLAGSRRKHSNRQARREEVFGAGPPAFGRPLGHSAAKRL